MKDIFEQASEVVLSAELDGLRLLKNKMILSELKAKTTGERADIERAHDVRQKYLAEVKRLRINA